MKKSVGLVSMLLIVVFTSTVLGAEDPALRARVEAFYQKQSQAVQSKNLEDLMAGFSPDFASVFAGPNFEQLRKSSEQIFNDYEKLRLAYKIETVSQSGSFIRVVYGKNLEGCKKNETEWKEISKETQIDYLIDQGGVLKRRASASIKKDRLKWLKDQTYSDTDLGVSFSVPKNWDLIPTAFPNMQGGVLILAPDGSSSGLFGYVELPSNIGAKEAVLSDDSVAKQLAKDQFEMIQSGPIKLGEWDAFESITKFVIPGDDRNRYRRRVYINAGGLLYVLNFDAIPPNRWDSVKDGFQSILNSFTLSAEAKKDSASRVRKLEATGQITNRIYNNDKYGCQIAAPKGWSIKSAPAGEAYAISVNITPPQGNSIIRFMGCDLKGKLKGKENITLETIAKEQIESVKILTKDVQNEPIQDTQIGSLKGKLIFQKFTLEGLGTMKRKMVMFLEHEFLYLVVCDANPPEEYDKLLPQFDEVINSLTIN